MIRITNKAKQKKQRHLKVQELGNLSFSRFKLVYIDDGTIGSIEGVKVCNQERVILRTRD